MKFTAEIFHHASDKPSETDTVTIDGPACDLADRYDRAQRIFRQRHGKECTIDIEPRPVPTIEAQEDGSAYLSKGIAYAFPTSHAANKYNKGKGFYYIEIYTPTSLTPAFGWDNLRNENWRWSSAEAAEQFAEQMPYRWNQTYKRFPKPGSRFEKTEFAA